MKRLRWSCACLLSLCLPALALEPAAGERRAPFLGGFLKETRVIYPLEVEGWKAKDEHRYEHQELGASVRYARPGSEEGWIDVYFYPAGVVSGTDRDEVLERTLEEIRLSVGQGGGEADLDAPTRLTYTLGSGKAREEVAASSTSMRLLRKGKGYHSAMVLLDRHLYFVKGRYSVPEASMSRRKVKQRLEDFIGDLLPETSLHSTGGCWMPLPVVEKADLGTEALGALVAISNAGRVLAAGYADRVEALEAASPAASATRAMAMSATGRLFEGCGPAEDMNPVVPPGKRELRLEFTAPPSEERDRQSVPLRQKATGLS